MILQVNLQLFRGKGPLASLSNRALYARPLSSRAGVCPVTSPYSAKSMEEGSLLDQRPHPVKRSASTAAVTATEVGEDVPILKHVPSLPFAGSMIPQYSGVPALRFNTVYDYFPTIRKDYGHFYTVGIPGLGPGLQGTTYMITDPEEMMKVVRSEGKYPSGSVETSWQFKSLLRTTNSPLVERKENGEYDYGLFDHGERWKKQRVFLQTGMLDPRAARGFVPAIVEAATLASKGAPLHSRELNKYVNYCAVDMFFSFMFGDLLGTAGKDPSELEGSVDAKFCADVVDLVQTQSDMIEAPQEMLLNDRLGLKTKRMKHLESLWDDIQRISMDKVQSFLDRYEKGNLSQYEKDSYLAGAIERLEEEGEDGMSKDEMIHLCVFTLTAAVDTTSTVTAWILLHLALNPEVQERLHSEITDALSAHNGNLDAETLSKSKSPYLHAILRETHRLTPPFSVSQMKSLQKSEVEVHGVTLPKGSMVCLSSVGRDPGVVDDPLEFKPERWLPKAVDERKGSPAEKIDHPIFRDPFMQGARRCPASRVASNEILAMIARLVLDWKITSPHVKSFTDVKYTGSIIRPVMPELSFAARS